MEPEAFIVEVTWTVHVEIINSLALPTFGIAKITDHSIVSGIMQVVHKEPLLVLTTSMEEPMVVLTWFSI